MREIRLAPDPPERNYYLSQGSICMYYFRDWIAGDYNGVSVCITFVIGLLVITTEYL
jgi:hypothetical protein